MTDGTAYMSETERKVLIAQSNKTVFPSNFAFLRSHNGYRNRCLHIVLGVAHGGKSTLVRTMLIDLLENIGEEKNIGLVLSEETRGEFLTEFYHSGYENEEKVTRFHILSELDMNSDRVNQDNFLDFVDFWATEKSLDILFIDNITTSMFYMDTSVRTQANMATKLKKIAANQGIPVVLVAHTGANVTENYSGFIEMNDIRGSKTINNLAQFYYIMQSFYVGDTRYNTVRIAKHRGQAVEDKFYLIDYSKKHRLFVKDQKVNFKRFKELWKERNRL